MRKALYGALSAAAGLAALLCITGCGLESFMLLEPPKAIDSPPSGTFGFSAGSTNNEFEFLGFELYYKFYLPPTQPNNSLNSLEQLQSDSFLRINNDLDSVYSISKPLILIRSIDKGTDYTVTIDFIKPEEPKITATVVLDRAIPGIRRGVRGLGLPPPYDAYFKPFYNYVQTDDDIENPPVLFDAIINSQPVTLALYVLSYGKDPSTRQDLYSQPVYLGSQSLILKNLPYP